MIRVYLVLVFLSVTVTNTSAQFQCIHCLPGKYKSVIANNACVSCPANFYLDYSGADDQSDCVACYANMTSGEGSSNKTQCRCNPGFYGPLGGPCLPCAKATYANNLGQSACSLCPSNADSDVQSDALTDCACVAGYTGANGSTCTTCAANKYKTTTGSHACTDCVANTMTLGPGNTVQTACICTPGYTAGVGGSGLFIDTYSSTAGTRFVALTPKPAFASVATRNDNAIGSAILPMYVASGGPNGKGHLDFIRANSQYLDGGPRTFNINTNGGLTIVGVVRFTLTGEPNYGYFERIISFSNTIGSNFVVDRDRNNFNVRLWNGPPGRFGMGYNWIGISATVIQKDIWMTFAVTYSASTKKCELSVNGVIVGEQISEVALEDRAFTNTYIGKSSDVTWPFFEGQIAGMFAVDEYLTLQTTTAIANAMKEGVDLTTVSGSSCTGCSAGKFKVDSGPAACTNCSVHTYSTAVAANSSATCALCPSNTVSFVGSAVLTACTCNTGYASPSGDGYPCAACLIGQYKDATGSAACTDCGFGKFSAAIAAKMANTCQNCPDVNSWTQTTGNDVLADCQCNAGYTGNNGEYCAACVRGKYKMITGPATCISCVANTYSTVLASITGADCASCPTSSQSPQSSSALAACICNMGYTGAGGSSVGQAVPCEACAAGKFKTTNGSAVCTDCVANTYSTVVAATINTCVGCPVYMQSAVASALITECRCNRGYTGLDGDRCTGCTAGKYKTTVGTNLCTDCPANEFSIQVNKSDSVCTTCLSITSQSLAGSDEPTDCKCNKGYTGPDGATCTGCIAGKYKTDAGSASCSSCLPDTYQPFTEKYLQSDCQTCPANSTSLSASPTLVSCQCVPGFSGANGGQCTQCYAGQFKPLKGPQACSICPNATWSSAFGATSNVTCVQCQAYSLSRAGSTIYTDCHCDIGYYTNHMLLPNATCSRCTPGTYNSELGAIACSKCTAGKYSQNYTASSNEVCKTCMVGYSAEGRSQCELCPENAIALPGSAVLQDCKCVPGYTGPNGGTCQFCIAGKFKTNNGSALCTNCPVDTFSDQTARTLVSDCEDCYDNSEALSGSDSFDKCKCSVGYTSSVAGQDGQICTPCSPGRYKNTTGHAACSACPNNTYVDVTTSDSINDCKQCFVNSVSAAGSDALDDCKCVGGFERASV